MVKEGDGDFWVDRKSAIPGLREAPLSGWRRLPAGWPGMAG
ncbi:hypothetical protein [uncultured Bacteroides sp.]|jgi:hypothetical protein|nr:hypothetical protein [uncultured Bacteroides sp.]